MSSEKRLCRSRSNRMIAGVCGGVADYLGIDTTLVRVLTVLIPGINLLTYFVLALIIPEE